MSQFIDYLERYDTIAEARSQVPYWPLVPTETLNCKVKRVNVYVQEVHDGTELAPEHRMFEIVYDRMFVAQRAYDTPDKARKFALETPYGDGSPVECEIGPYKGRCFEKGEDDPPGVPNPATVTWCDDCRFFIVFSEEFSVEDLLEVARSMVA